MKLRRFYGAYLAAGFVFLFNPIVSLFDILPDFIGCLLIAHGLKEIGVLEYRLESAGRIMYYGAGVSLARTVLMLFVFDMDSGWVLSTVSLLGVAQGIVYISFFVSFFGGLIYLAQRSDSENVLSVVDGVKLISIVFVLVNVLAAILPQLAALPELAIDYDPDSYGGLTPGKLTRYKNYATVLLFTVSAAAGVWWLRSILSFMKGVRADIAFKASLEKRYGDYVGDTPMEETYIRLLGATLFYLFALVFCTNLRIYDEVGKDYITVLPAAVGSLLFGVAHFRLGCKKSFLALYGAVAAAQALFIWVLDGGVLATVGSVALWAGVALCSFTASGALRDSLQSALGLKAEGKVFALRLAMGVYVALSVLLVFWYHSAVHSIRVLAFAAWAVLYLRLYSAARDEIRPRRKF